MGLLLTIVCWYFSTWRSFRTRINSSTRAVNLQEEHTQSIWSTMSCDFLHTGNQCYCAINWCFLWVWRSWFQCSQNTSTTISLCNVTLHPRESIHTLVLSLCGFAVDHGTLVLPYLEVLQDSKQLIHMSSEPAGGTHYMVPHDGVQSRVLVTFWALNAMLPLVQSIDALYESGVTDLNGIGGRINPLHCSYTQPYLSTPST